MIHLFIRRANFIDESWIEEKKKEEEEEEEEEEASLSTSFFTLQTYRFNVSALRFYRAKQCAMRLRDKTDDEARVNGALGLIHRQSVTDPTFDARF